MKRRNMRLRRALLMTCCAAALVAISVGATLAYLTDTEGVTNTFTVGHVDIMLNETDVDGDGSTQANAYHLLPGQNYKKDPTITVEEGSEDAFVVAKIDVTGMKAENNPMLYTEGDVSGFIGFGDVVGGGVFGAEFAKNVSVNDKTAAWTAEHFVYGDIKLTQTINEAGKNYTFYIYFEDEFEQKDGDQAIVLFDKLNIPGEWTNDQIAAIGGMQMSIKAYAIQSEGFGSVYEAFGAGNDTGWSADYDFDGDETVAGTNP